MSVCVSLCVCVCVCVCDWPEQGQACEENGALCLNWLLSQLDIWLCVFEKRVRDREKGSERKGLKRDWLRVLLKQKEGHLWASWESQRTREWMSVTYNCHGSWQINRETEWTAHRVWKEERTQATEQRERERERETVGKSGAGKIPAVNWGDWRYCCTVALTTQTVVSHTHTHTHTRTLFQSQACQEKTPPLDPVSSAVDPLLFSASWQSTGPGTKVNKSPQPHTQEVAQCTNLSQYNSEGPLEENTV